MSEFYEFPKARRSGPTAIGNLLAELCDAIALEGDSCPLLFEVGPIAFDRILQHFGPRVIWTADTPAWVQYQLSNQVTVRLYKKP